MSVDILFVPQNSNHVQNFIIIADYLKIKGYKIAFLLLDNYLYQSTEKHVKNRFPYFVLESNLIEPFYKVGYLKRVAAMLFAKRKLKDMEVTPSCIVSGTDGALMHAIYDVLGQRSVKLMIVDGLLTQPNRFQLCKLRGISVISRCAQYLKLSHMLPTVLGISRVDRVYVMLPSVRDVLAKMGCRKVIKVAMLPRHQEYMGGAVTVPKGTRLRVLYATTAYQWHGLEHKSRLQKEEVRYLIDKARELVGEISLRIRFHPRDCTSEYDLAKILAAGVDWSDGNRPLLPDLLWCDVVVSSGSSISMEARLMGKHVFMLSKVFEERSNDDPLIKDLFIETVGGLEELMDRVRQEDPLVAQHCLAFESDILIDIDKVMAGDAL